MNPYYMLIEKIADPLIISGFVLSILGFAMFTVSLIKNRFNLKTAIFSVFCLVCLVFLTYATYVNPFDLVTKEVTVDLKNLNSGASYKFLIVSDLHAGKFKNDSMIKKITETINSQDDINYVLVLGDIINGEEENLKYLDGLKEIDKSKKLYYVYGNHDYKNNKGGVLVDGLRSKLEGLGFEIIDNSTIEINSEDRIILGGIEDEWSKRDEYDFYKDVDTDDVLLMLSHNPDVVMKIDKDPQLKSKTDLVLSGHTHGGEMRLPWFGSISNLPIHLPQSYDKGLFEYNDIPLYITSGIGNIGVRTRSFNNPEIIILTIK